MRGKKTTKGESGSDHVLSIIVHHCSYLDIHQVSVHKPFCVRRKVEPYRKQILTFKTKQSESSKCCNITSLYKNNQICERNKYQVLT